MQQLRCLVCCLTAFKGKPLYFRCGENLHGQVCPLTAVYISEHMFFLCNMSIYKATSECYNLLMTHTFLSLSDNEKVVLQATIKERLKSLSDEINDAKNDIMLLEILLLKTEQKKAT